MTVFLCSLVDIFRNGISGTSSTSKEKILNLLVTKPENLNEDQLSALYLFYPKLTEILLDDKYRPWERTKWTPAYKNSLFAAACEVEDEEFVRDVIQACRKAKCIKPILFDNMKNLGGVYYDLFQTFSEDVALEWIDTMVEVDREQLYNGEIVHYDFQITKAIFIIIKYGKISALQKLFTLCPDLKRLLLEKDHKGRTPLHVAVNHIKPSKGEDKKRLGLCGLHNL